MSPSENPYDWDELLKAMPQHSSWILHHSNIGGDIGFFVLHQGNIVAIKWDIKKLPQLVETCESPITFVYVVPMRCH